MTTEREHCEHCGRDTVTVLLPLSSGHVGRCCVCCRSCRKGRPFASKAEFENLKHADGHTTRGLDYENRSR